MTSPQYYCLNDAMQLTAPCATLPSLFRGQRYSDQPGVSWGPVNFRHNPDRNRFTPRQVDAATAYFGQNAITAFMEAFPLFRQRSLAEVPPRFPIAASKLKKWELIEFRIAQPLKLLSLTDDKAISRHRLKASITTDVDLTAANDFAQAVLQQTDFDGISYYTRQGAHHAVVVFNRAAEKLQNPQIVSRQSFYQFFLQNPSLPRDLSVQLVEDSEPSWNQ